MTMKHILFFILLFISAPVIGQTLYTTGVTFCAGVPVHNPGTTGAKWALDTTTWNLYVRSYGTTWTLIGNNWIQNISGCAAPAYTPTKHQSKVVINACNPPELYAWDGAAWDQIGAGSGGLTGTGLANRLGIWTDAGAIGYESTLLVDTVNNRLKIGNQVAPVRTLDVEGEARISDLTTDTPTRLVGADADGDLGDAGLGLTNRVAFWTGTGRVGYESTIRIDSTNNALLLNTTGANGPISGVRPRLEIVDGSSRICYTPQYSFGPIVEITNGTVTSLGPFIDNGLSAAIFGTFSNHNLILRRNNSNFMTFGSAGISSNSFSELSFGSTGGVATTSFNLYESSNIRYGAYAASGATRIFCPSSGVPSPAIEFGTVSTADGTTWSEKARITGANGNMLVGHTTDANARLDINGSGSTSATDAANFANSNDSTIVRIRNDRRVGINTATPDVSLDAGDNTDAIKIPSGTTAQEPAVNNTLRFNSDRESLDARENGVMFRLTSSKTPSIAAGAAAGTGPTIAVAGNDLSMKVTLTTGTTATTGALFTVTYASSMDAGVTNYPVFSCADVDCTGLNLYVSAESNTAFTISTQNAPTDAVQYIINIHIGQ